MTPEQIKQWTIQVPHGTIYPESGASWYCQDEHGRHGPFTTWDLAFEYYWSTHQDDGTACLNCGS